MKCKICNSEETIRSFASHLRWHHKEHTTETYVEKFGEFRPKKIQNDSKKEKSNIKCEICNEKMMHNRQLMYHITTKHKDISPEEYIIKYIYKNVHPLCKCGCGQKVTIINYGKKENGKIVHHVNYIKGHWDWVKPGYHHHTEETKLQMRKSAIKRLENEKGLFKGTSKLEIEFQNFIKQNYTKNIILNNTTILSGLELDIYLPELKLAFEFNGTYYHSDLYKDKNFHLKKTKECNKQNIKLIHIWDTDWIKKRKIIESLIINQLNQTKEKVYARKCEIKPIKKETSALFLENNHLQGNCISSINLGLYYKDELVSIMTFGKLRKNLGNIHKENHYELLRFCNKLNTNVVGGASKLFKYFIKTYNPLYILSYANRDWSQGNLYIKLNMTSLSPTPPGYHWYKSKIRYNRFLFRKDILIKQGADPNKTEYEIMIEKGYYRTWNTGNLKFEWIK